MPKRTPPGQCTLVFDEPSIVEAAVSTEASIAEDTTVGVNSAKRRKKEKQPAPVTEDSIVRDIIKLFEGFRYRHQIYQVFTDFCATAAISISNRVDGGQYEAREKEYLSMVKRYSKEEVDNFPQILAKLTTALSELGPQDILGNVYMGLEISNRDRGQFFTPRSVSECMAKMTLIGIGEHIDRQGHFTMCEPACGGGSMVFAACKAVNEQGYDYREHMHVTAIDKDLKCTHMCYIQMSLLGVPGVVYHGDTLSLQMESVWWTPQHVAGDWHKKLGWDKESEEEAKEAA